MAEWFNAAVLKTVEGATPPRVRISASPPIKQRTPERVFFALLRGGKRFELWEKEFDHKRKRDESIAVAVSDERRGGDFKHGFESKL